MRLAPGDPATLALLAGKAEGSSQRGLSEDALKGFREAYGLEPALPVWYEQGVQKINHFFGGTGDPEFPNRFERVAYWVAKRSIEYGHWVNKVLRFDFGMSLKDQRWVIQKIKEALPLTLTLNLIEVLFVYLIAIPLGVRMAGRPNSWPDRFLNFFFLLLYSIPTFLVAYLLMIFFAGGKYLSWFPLAGFQSEAASDLPWYGWLADVSWHLVLPVVCMVYGSFAFLYRFSRSNLLDVLRQDYIRTARAKGLSEETVLWKHGFRNALIPMVTLFGALIPSLMAGSVIIEQIFSIPGMGKLTFDSIWSRDYPTLMGVLTLQSLITLFSMFLVDLVYLAVDPRIHFGSGEQRPLS